MFFSYDSETRIKKTTQGVTHYKRNYNNGYIHNSGSVFEQANKSIQILPLMLETGVFKEVSRSGATVRVKHDVTTSATSGSVDTSKNVFFNHSGSLFEGRKLFFQLLTFYIILNLTRNGNKYENIYTQ